MRRKQEIIDDITSSLGAPPIRTSTGSTEPREVFDLINDALGLQVESGGPLTKPQMAEAIVEASGNPWLPTFESRGGTVTAQGLEAVFDAVQFFLGR